MDNAPERIWAKVHGASTDILTGQRELLGGWNERARNGQAEYIRADLVPQWHHMETAPRDGTPVDLWVINHLSYDKHSSRMVNVKFGPVQDWMGIERDDWQHGRGEDCEPTHWMPIPAPPKGVS